MWYGFLLEGLKNFAGQIIGAILHVVMVSKFSWLRNLFTRYKKLKKGENDDTEVRQTLSEIKRQLENQHSGEAQLQQAEEARRRAEIERQLEAQRQELERIKARKKQPAMSDDAFLELCESGNARKVEKAIMNGANVNAKNNNGVTALILLVLYGYGRTDIAELLIKHGADVNAKNNNGATALMSAAFNGRTDIAELLINHGADVNAKDNRGWTALMWAAKHGKTYTAKLLRKHGAKVNGFFEWLFMIRSKITQLI